MTAALSLVCKQCNTQLKSVKEAQDHGEATGHTNFEESTEPVLNLVCTACGKPCRTQTERDLHTKRTGHAEFTDQTLTAATPMDTEAQMKSASDAMREALKGDSAASAHVSDQDVKDAMELVPAAVNTELRKNLEDMGFDTNKATRALHFCGAENLEAAVNWIVEHADDPDINDPLLVPKEKIKPKLSPEEAAKAAEELRLRIKAKREQEERETERLREQERIRSGKELLEAKKKEEELQLKRNLELRRIEKEEEERARAKIRAKLEEDRRERRRKLGLPEELTEDEKAAEARKQAEKAAAAKKTSFVTVKPVSVAAKMRETLVQLKKSHADNEAGVTTCFQTLMKYCGNVASNPQEEKFRSIKLSNAAFQKRVGSFSGSIEFLELTGFKRTSDGEALSIPADAVDMTILNTAGKELNDALNNPWFGKL